MVEQEAILRNFDWLVIVVVINLAVIAWLKVNYSKWFRKLFYTLFQNRFYSNLIREDESINNSASFLLFFLFLLNSAAVFTIYDVYWSVPFLNGPPVFKLLIGIVTISFFVFIKVSILYLFILILQLKNFFEFYIFYMFLIFKVLSIIILPFLIVLGFATFINLKLIFWLLAISAGFLFIYRIFKTVLNSLDSYNPNYYYLFMYICGFEFLPYLFVVKALG